MLQSLVFFDGWVPDSSRIRCELRGAAVRSEEDKYAARVADFIKKNGPTSMAMVGNKVRNSLFSSQSSANFSDFSREPRYFLSRSMCSVLH